MHAVLKNVSFLLLSLFFLYLGNGLQMTLLSLRAKIEGFSDLVVALMASSYYVGFIVGGLVMPRLVETVGHIRTFSGLASLISISTVLHIYWVDSAFWIFLRPVTGFCIVGMLMVAESWLNTQSDNTNRGSVFSVYVILTLVAIALGQQLLLVHNPSENALFIMSTIIFSLAVIPVALGPSVAPAPLPSERMGIKKLFKITPVGVSNAFGAGIIGGIFWGMAPVYAYDIELPTAQIAIFMSSVVLGGILLQWPIGSLSDRMDRRNVILGVCVGLLVTGTVLSSVGAVSIYVLAPICVVFGGFLFTLGSLATAYTNDHLDPADMVQASGTLLLIYGVGAAIGPYLASTLMQIFGSASMFYSVAAIALMLFVYTFYRRLRREAPDSSGDFISIPETSAYMSELDPRMDTEDETPI